MKKTFASLIMYAIFVFLFVRYSPPFKPQAFAFHQSSRMVAPTGYVQTPLGGEPGTSDLKRPTLSELGIRKQPINDSYIFVNWRNVGIYFVTQQIRSHNQARLNKTLRTYGKKLPTGTLMSHYLQLDNHSFGITYRFDFNASRFIPCFEISVLDFAYVFDSIIAAGDRHYRHVTLSSGFLSQWNLGKRNVRELSYLTSLPFADGLNITRSSHLEKQKLRIDYQDGQTLPNHILFKGEWSR